MMRSLLPGIHKIKPSIICWLVSVLYCYYRFEFLKCLSGKLVNPNVPSTHEWTGERVRQIAAQGDVYIRTTYPLNLDGLHVSLTAYMSVNLHVNGL